MKNPLWGITPEKYSEFDLGLGKHKYSTWEVAKTALRLAEEYLNNSFLNDAEERPATNENIHLMANQILAARNLKVISDGRCPHCQAEAKSRRGNLKAVFHGATAPGGPYGTIRVEFDCGTTYTAKGFFSQLDPDRIGLTEILYKDGQFDYAVATCA